MNYTLSSPRDRDGNIKAKPVYVVKDGYSLYANRDRDGNIKAKPVYVVNESGGGGEGGLTEEEALQLIAQETYDSTKSLKFTGRGDLHGSMIYNAVYDQEGNQISVETLPVLTESSFANIYTNFQTTNLTVNGDAMQSIRGYKNNQTSTIGYSITVTPATTFHALRLRVDALEILLTKKLGVSQEEIDNIVESLQENDEEEK